MRREKQPNTGLDQLAELLLLGAWIKELYFDGKIMKWKVLFVDDKPKGK